MESHKAGRKCWYSYHVRAPDREYQGPIVERRATADVHRTDFGSLTQFEKGRIELICDRSENYAFSNVFEVASNSAPYEKVVVGKNLKYVIEALRAEGRSGWYAASHDEFALVMDGVIELELVKLDDASRTVPAHVEGSVKLDGEPAGRRMGYMILRRGHQALLPKGTAYRFGSVGAAGVIVMQTIVGKYSVQKWAEICFTTGYGASGTNTTVQPSMGRLAAIDP
jgi:hypothetical protein